MLKGYNCATMIPVKDLEGARRFYEDTLGFGVSHEDPGGVIYQSGTTAFSIYPTEFAGLAKHTLMGWAVDDLESTMDELTERGVTFERYDMPGLKTDEKGVATLGDQKGAWFKDPEGNILSLWWSPEGKFS